MICGYAGISTDGHFIAGLKTPVTARWRANLLSDLHMAQQDVYRLIGRGAEDVGIPDLLPQLPRHRDYRIPA